MRILDALRSAPIESLEAEILLCIPLQCSRSWLIAHGEDDLPADKQAAFQAFVSRRRRGEPVAYITGVQEFFGRPFSVNPHVLIPRPSTEGLVSLALEFLEHPSDQIRTIDQGIVAVSKVWKQDTRAKAVADIGTGSGCIAVTLASECVLNAHAVGIVETPRRGVSTCEVHDVHVIAVDLSEEALKVARENAERLGVFSRIRFVQGDLLEPLRELTEPFLVVSNPPYIPEGHALPRDVAGFEPAQALFAGKDGLSVLKALVQQAQEHPFCTGVVLECQEDQASALLG
ncbi:TPA: peptide chain release factor N(5)-glutamine methyltransferase [Candidatus Peribacteria bacterium]|nr:MAG: protein-(glutamine-N5) methyltransferase, release factor-specific [Candidatus Peribacteria bacterium RIFOXYC2_FULL_58_10]OGJ83788.1 MAG: protein-(glutamine-N5) methyltransferase, release factor-specific [Candidatus Peribacteria bacterium RIFOXYD2_FULL_58_15]HAI98512.1 peptide chain release factor N(5)-glutamine methyltransferase [Candidatus Peribacteria bacterium]HAS34224.1 peptide chain release factor N(5)-glutamine methyltransferase [Candidatus Peribacteria bacterium]